MLRIFVAGIVLFLAGAVPAGAQVAGPRERQAIYDATPSCKDHPDFPIIGRVSGGAEDINDGRVYLTFVGCFPDQATCDRWKGRATNLITATIVEYSCKPRG